MAVFVDTGAIVALLAPGDPNHEAAVEAYARLTDAGALCLSDDVFDETITQLRKKAGHGVAAETGRSIRQGERFRLIQCTPDDRQRAWTLFERHGKVVRSLTDCSSAAVMERLGIRTIFTFDSDFHAFGLTVVP